MQISRIILSIAYVASMTLSADAMPARVADDGSLEIHSSMSEGYRLRFFLTETNDSSLKLTINHPDGSPVSDAQVVIALIDPKGRNHQSRATAIEDGYLVATDSFASELCRVEAEVITGGQLLTTHFHINPTT